MRTVAVLLQVGGAAVLAAAAFVLAGIGWGLAVTGVVAVIFGIVLERES